MNITGSGLEFGDDLFIPGFDGEESQVEEIETPENNEEEESEEEVEKPIVDTPDEDEEGEDSEIDAQVQFIESLKTYGLELTADELEAVEGDISKAIEVKTVSKAEAMLNAYFDRLDTPERNAMNAILSGAKLNELLDIVDTNLDVTIEQLESDPELQEKIIREDLKERGRSEKEINLLLKALGDDKSEEAKESLERMRASKVNKATAKQQEITKRQQEQETRTATIVKESKENLSKLEDFIPSKKLSKKEIEALNEEMFKTYNEITSNPSKYIPVLGILKKYGVLDGKFDALTAKAETKANKNLVDTLRNSTKKRSASTTKKEGDSLEAELKLFLNNNMY